MEKSNSRIVAINTASNYALVLVRIVYAILVTRLLFRTLGEDLYGFWSILWAFFAYAAIFNFGFGATIQKYTAEHLFESNPQKYNKIISLVIIAYAFASVAILGIAALGIFSMQAWTNISDPSAMRECQISLAIFAAGVAVIFPLSSFADILAGMRLIYLKNAVMISLRIAEMAGIWIMMSLGFGLAGIVVFSIAANIFFLLLIAAIAKSKIPALRFVPRPGIGVFKEIRSFSLFVYLNSIAMLVTAKTDRFILSSLLGLPAVSSYQIGTRLPEMSLSLSSQFQDNVIPVAANLAKQNDTAALRKILLGGMRFCAFVSAGATAIFFMLSEATVKVLFGVCTPEMDLVCKIFLFSQFLHCAVRNVPYRYLQVSQKHRQIAAISSLQAAATIFLGIVLCKKFGVVGIAWAALVPNAAFSAAAIFPMAAMSLNFSIGDVLKIYLSPILAAVPPVIFCHFAKQFWGGEILLPANLALAYLAAGALYAAFGWLFGLTKEEKSFILNKTKNIGKFFTTP